VGDYATVLRYNGTSWSQTSLPYTNTFLTVWGAASNNVFVGGELGLMLRWDGTALRELSSGGSDTISQIRGSSANLAWMISDAGLSKWDGTSWKEVTGVNVSVVFAASDTSAVVVGYGVSYFWNGMTWTNRGFSTTSPQAVWFSGRDAWASDSYGTLFRYNGTDWTRRW
jgi:hypothetical protein